MYRTLCLITLCILLMPLDNAGAQDLEPRRWTPLPAGLSLVGVGYARIEGDVFFNPVLSLEDTVVDGHATAVSYVRSFALGNRVGRLDVLVPWANMRWTGVLDGLPATASRVGMADPSIRLSIILAGAKPDKLASSNTVVGAAVKVIVPFGEYFADKLLNLGHNRIVVRPQLGVLHTRGKWSYELTGSLFLYGNNDDFFDGSELKQDTLYALQAHVIHNFDKPGIWAALSAGYGWDGQSTINGNKVRDRRRLFLSALAVGVPIAGNQSIKLAYTRTRTNVGTGADLDVVSVGWSYRF
jgi:hypothetical protein